MKWYFFTFRSVTAAQRGENVLKKSGIACTLRRTPRWMETRGCGYCLRVREQEWEDGLNVLARTGTAFSRVYAQNPDGSVVEVEYDLPG